MVCHHVEFRIKLGKLLAKTHPQKLFWSCPKHVNRWKISFNALTSMIEMIATLMRKCQLVWLPLESVTVVSLIRHFLLYSMCKKN